MVELQSEKVLIHSIMHEFLFCFTVIFSLLQKSNVRFLDTMSLHIAVCGLTNFQRILYKASQNNSQRKEVREWKLKHQDRFIVRIFEFGFSFDCEAL